MSEQYKVIYLRCIRCFFIWTVLFCLGYHVIMLLYKSTNSDSTNFPKDMVQCCMDGDAEIAPNSTKLKNGTGLCQKLSPALHGLLNTFLIPVKESLISNNNPNIRSGGRFVPEECQARHNTAIIIPFRNRSDHLNMFLLDIFLSHMHPFLQRQQLAYTIFVIEQDGQLIFNKGRLMNIGFVEASKLDNFDCFIFHDTDLLPENDHNLYSCSPQPTLLAVAINIFEYKPMYWNHFGGAISIRRDQFTAVNGYPNLYWGWGHEDDDFSERVRLRFGHISRRHRDIGRYTMIQHDKDGLNPKNDLAYHLAKTALHRATTDGLSNLRYRVVETEKRPLYTWILADVGQPPKLLRLLDGTLTFIES